MEVEGVRISNADRVVFPGADITKGEVAEYLAQAAERMLPELANRPLVLVRCPAGRAKECFYQKHWPGDPPPALLTVPIRQSDGIRPYVMVKDAAGLVTLAQWGVLEIHPWGSRADDVEKPDRITFDLDPGEGVEWSAMRRAARELRQVLEALGLESWLKTSGGKGLHVVVPIERRSTWDEVNDFARGVAESLAAAKPEQYLSRAKKSERVGRIFIDWMRNGRGATSVAAWSLRARPGAGVSVPIAWEKLGRVSAGDAFTIKNALKQDDAWRDMSSTRQRLTRRILEAVS